MREAPMRSRRSGRAPRAACGQIHEAAPRADSSSMRAVVGGAFDPGRGSGVVEGCEDQLADQLEAPARRSPVRGGEPDVAAEPNDQAADRAPPSCERCQEEDHVAAVRRSPASTTSSCPAAGSGPEWSSRSPLVAGDISAIVKNPSRPSAAETPARRLSPRQRKHWRIPDCHAPATKTASRRRSSSLARASRARTVLAVTPSQAACSTVACRPSARERTARR